MVHVACTTLLSAFVRTQQSAKGEARRKTDRGIPPGASQADLLCTVHSLLILELSNRRQHRLGL